MRTLRVFLLVAALSLGSRAADAQRATDIDSVDGVPAGPKLAHVFSRRDDAEMLGAFLSAALHLAATWDAPRAPLREYCLTLIDARGHHSVPPAVMRRVRVPAGVHIGTGATCTSRSLVWLRGLELASRVRARSYVGVACGALCGAEWLVDFQRREQQWYIAEARLGRVS